MSPKRSTLVYFDEETVRRLDSLKAKTGAPKGEHIRRAVAEYLDRQEAVVEATEKAERKRAATRKRS